MNAFFSALILFVQYFSDFADTYRTLRWLMGDLDVSSYQPILTSLPLLAIAFIAFAWLAAAAEPAQPRRRQRGDARPRHDARAAAGVLRRFARHRRGVSPSAARSASSASSSRTSSACWSDRDHRVVLPASALLGAAFLVVCDVLARTLIAPIEIPVGVITALLGGPFFLWLLVRRT